MPLCLLWHKEIIVEIIQFLLILSETCFLGIYDLRNPRSEISTGDRARHCSNCPCSVHPVATHGFRLPVTSDRCIYFYLFIWHKRKNALLLNLVVAPLPLFPSYSLVMVIVPSISFLRTLTSCLKSLSPFHMRAKKSHLESSTCTH